MVLVTLFSVDVPLDMSVARDFSPARNAWAQNEAQQPTPDDEVSLAQCAQVQPVVQKLIEDASLRLEAARQTNSASVLRAAVDDVDGVLRDLRAQLAPCAKTKVLDPHTGHAMPATVKPAPSTAKPAPVKPIPAKPPTAK